MVILTCVLGLAVLGAGGCGGQRHAGSAARSSRATGEASSALRLARAALKRRALPSPAPTVEASPNSTCFVASAGCSLNPCKEFIRAAPVSPSVHATPVPDSSGCSSASRSAGPLHATLAVAKP